MHRLTGYTFALLTALAQKALVANVIVRINSRRMTKALIAESAGCSPLREASVRRGTFAIHRRRVRVRCEISRAALTPERS